MLIGFDILCYIVIALLYFISTIVLERVMHYDPINYLINASIMLASIMMFRFIFKIYLSIWRYSNTATYLKMVLSDCIGALFALFLCRFTGLYTDVWVFVIVASLSCLMVLSSRFCYCLVYRRRKKMEDDGAHKIPVAIVGAGQLGAILADELLCARHSNYQPMFFIDRDTTKVGSRISGLTVYPENDAIIDFIKDQEIEEIFFALAKLDHETASSLYERYSKTNCKIKIYDMSYKDADIPSESNVKRMSQGVLHDFRIEDLLFRKSISIDNSFSSHYYTGKKVLVTGGGGSIGSELCRQIAKCKPAELIILDIYENNAYDIQQELSRKYGNALKLSVEIASVRDRVRLESIFKHYRPDIVFHAAAHKHVPLMEHSGCEAVKNNVMGTYNTADMAEKYNVRKFILISTDKAVNPTNIMGASKRMCEMIVQCRKDSETSFAAVRFGNVLGSNGSVIPLFRRQIAEGGPVTITDKRIIRYFMTIPEASQLVMQAGAMAKRGELFVLDMGKPVRIYDLAVNMIRLCGLTPDVDIKIEEIGLRPGEKLYEELLIKTEALTRTENNMIFIETDAPLSRAEVEQKLADLNAAVAASAGELSSDSIRDALHRAVPTFQNPDEVNQKAAEAEEMQEAVAH
ncbi:MAG: polysaccharide biosynthesis protein [Clostridia bacterium]|nr:polysaccharide biosynthesis protein [Clostridia bacterium]